MRKGGGKEGEEGRSEIGREGGMAGGRRKVGVRELEVRQVGGGRMKERGRREGGGETGGRIKVGVMEMEGRKLGGLEEGGREEGVR